MAYFDLPLHRKQEIEEILLELMKDTPYDRITVKSITDKMQIARKTYYHYFPNKQACLESLMDRLVTECSLRQMGLPEHSTLPDLCKDQLSFWVQQRPFLEAILRNHLSPLLVQRILLHVCREGNSLLELLNTRDLDCDEDVLFFRISGHVSLMLKWCSEGFSLSLDEMARKILRLSQEPMLPPRNN